MYYLQGSKYNMCMVLLDDEIHKITPDHDLRYSPAQKIVIDLEFTMFSNPTVKDDSSFLRKSMVKVNRWDTINLSPTSGAFYSRTKHLPTDEILHFIYNFQLVELVHGAKEILKS